MNTRLKIEDIPEELRKHEGAYVKEIMNVNWKPHPFMICPRHVSYAADHCGSILSDEVTEKIGCCMPDSGPYRGRPCGRKYSEHTCDTVALIAFTGDIAEPVLRAWLVKIADLNLPGLDGFSFLESTFKITK